MRYVRMSCRGAGAFAIACLTSCSGTPEGTITIVTGDETDVMSRAPAPVTLLSEIVALDGKRTEKSRAQLPTDTVNLGELPKSDIGAIAVAGLDPAGKPLVRGETLFVQWGALADAALEVFVQRTGELARMPRGPSAISPTVATIVAGRYVLAANGTATTLYDLLGLRTLSSSPTLPRPAKSITTVGSAAVVIDEAGATTFDLSNGQTFPLEPPAGGTFAEIAGGAEVSATDGTQFVVGATRSSGGPSARVLVIDPEGKATFASLAAPREGACATYIEGRGLVVYGGDTTAAGAEVLAPGASVATPLPFPPDAAKGCAAVRLDAGHVAIAGGVNAAGETGPARVLDLACTSGCAPAPWPDPIPLVRAQAYGLAPDAAFVVGDDVTGATHAYRASATGLREVPLKLPRRGARLVLTPIASGAVIGGGAGIEQYLE